MRALILLVLLAAQVPAWADKYVRDGGSSSSCTDWTNACDQLTTAEGVVSRGETIWVADGTYNGGTLDVSESGTSTITIKKATVASHGTSTGWLDTYGDGQATIGDLIIGTNYWVIDGATRNESDWSDGNAYGFRISSAIEANSSITSTCADNITIKYVNAGGAEGNSYTGSEPDVALQVSCFLSGQDNNSWTIQRSYFHNIAHFALLLLSSMDGATIEYNLLKNGWGKEGIRGQFVSKNLIIRFNRFENSCGTASPDACTADIALWSGDTTGSHDGNEIYGNTFYQSNTNGHDLNTGGSIVVGGNGSTWVGVSASNTKVYNNSFTGLHGSGQHGSILINGGSGNVCQNNLWYNVDNPTASCNTASNNTNAGANPFVSVPGMALSGATSAGTTLSSPYNTDMTGATRGSDGTWDRGAFEYAAGGSGPPAPTNIRIIGERDHLACWK